MRVYRAVTPAESTDAARAGRLRAALGMLEGKWFAESLADAAAWGRRFYDGKPFDILTVEVEDTEAAEWFRLSKLDNIGPARWARPDQLASVLLVEVTRVG